MDKEKPDKTEQIIEAAQKRFGLYGLEKTSMQEIANDIGLSKASLYYYFPDKESIYKAVIEKEQKEFIRKITLKVNSRKDPDKILIEYISARLEYFRTLLNLGRLKHDEFSSIKPVLKDLLDSFSETETGIISGILKAGIENGIFVKMNTSQAAALFLDMIKGLRISVLTSKDLLTIDPEEFDRLHSRTLEFTRIFIKGIKKNK
jgi:AcrR family transcriptional regulator